MQENWDKPLERYCGNCGTHLYGHFGSTGFARFQCQRCGMVSVAKLISRRVMRVEEHAPLGQKLI